MTSYLVFAKGSGVHPDGGTGDAWLPVGTFEARSAKHAISLAVADIADPHPAGETYAACPESSWCVQTIRVETHTRVRFQEAT